MICTKKTMMTIGLLVFATVMLLSLSFNIRAVNAQAGYSIDHVSHIIEIMYNGYVNINDTVTLNVTGQAPNSFLVGFPQKYGSYVLEATAFSGSSFFDVSLDVSLDNHVGFYAVKIAFPLGAPTEFTVNFVLSNSLLQQDASNASLYTLDFPAYPSLTEVAAVCNVSFALPSAASFVSGTVSGLTYGTENLQAFTYSPASLTVLVPNNQIQLVNVDQLRREVSVNEFGEVDAIDSYVITNVAFSTLSVFEFVLPPNATQPVAEDQFGRTMATPTQTSVDLNRYKVNLTLQVETTISTRFSVKYVLPSYLLTQSSGNDFNLALPFFQNINYYVAQASVTFTLPEGATVLNPPSNLTSSTYDVARSVFQEQVTVNMQGVTHLDNVSVGVEYWYNPLWLSFRPTIWVWFLSIVGCAVLLVWRRPKAEALVVAPSAALRLRPESLRSFVDMYEEKMKIMVEMDTMEVSVQKGRIPRRRYKVRRKMLETRLSMLSRSLEEAREKMRGAGSHYVDLMRQLEIAETDIKEAETNVRSIEARHNRGELSLEAHRKLLADYERRKENAETTINGILIRLREEIR
jgi:hypothetical protein